MGSQATRYLWCCHRCATYGFIGVAALVLNANLTLTPAQVEYILTTTANRML
jgi:hypothetical protein